MLRSADPAAAIRKLSGHLAGFSWTPPIVMPEAPIRAAVLIPLVVQQGTVKLLLTRRTEHLRHHAGQISFPGGRCDPEDSSAEHTALRECEEEVGIPAQEVELLGCLPDFPVPSGFVITPVLGLIQGPLRLSLDAFEVAEAFEVPLIHLLQRANYQRHRIQRQGHVLQVHAIAYRAYFIWGATAGILAMLASFWESAQKNAEN